MGLILYRKTHRFFTEPGEIVLGPLKSTRSKTANCLSIYYGEGRGLNCCNIFGKVVDEDLPLLKALGTEIWKNGAQNVIFEAIESQS
jgi:hypothetical protein